MLNLPRFGELWVKKEEMQGSIGFALGQRFTNRAFEAFGMGPKEVGKASWTTIFMLAAHPHISKKGVA